MGCSTAGEILDAKIDDLHNQTMTLTTFHVA